MQQEWRRVNGDKAIQIYEVLVLLLKRILLPRLAR
jgi:hypothetical protein